VVQVVVEEVLTTGFQHHQQLELQTLAVAVVAVLMFVVVVLVAQGL
jgi:hypothetical protein